MNVKLSLTGVKEIDRVLKAMPQAITHNVLAAAHAAAARPLVEKAKLLAPEGPTGNLIDSIGTIKTPMKKANSIGEVAVGPRRRRPYKGHHGHLIEYGHWTRRGKNKKSTGKDRFIEGKPFMKPAFEATKQLVINNITTELGKKLYSTMKRYIKK